MTAWLDVLQLMTEKGNHIKVRRQLEQMTLEHAQLAAESGELRTAVAKLTSDAERFATCELELKTTADGLAAELRAMSADRDRLARELEDRRLRDAAVQDNIEVCVVTRHCVSQAPCGLRVVRIDPLRFLAGCRTRRLNQV